MCSLSKCCIKGMGLHMVWGSDTIQQVYSKRNLAKSCLFMSTLSSDVSFETVYTEPDMYGLCVYFENKSSLALPVRSQSAKFLHVAHDEKYAPFVQIMACRLVGAKPLSDPMSTRFAPFMLLSSLTKIKQNKLGRIFQGIPGYTTFPMLDTPPSPTC